MMTEMTRKQMLAWLWRWLPALILMGIIFYASSTPKRGLPDLQQWDFAVKKSGHVAGYALLGAAYLRGLAGGRPLTRRWAALALLGAALYGATDEFHQLFVSGRGAAVSDVLIDTAGAAGGIALWAFIQTRVRPGRPRRPSTPQ